MQVQKTSLRRALTLVACQLLAAHGFAAQPASTRPDESSNADSLPAWKHEIVTLRETEPDATVHLIYRSGAVQRHPVILMLGSLDPDNVPPWSTDLLQEGYMLAAFTVAHPPDPDPARRPQWLYFDPRFAHGYVLGGARAPADAGRVINTLIARGDVHPQKIGWIGSSSTGIPGLAVATREPRLAAIVAFVSTGAYRQWLDTWQPNGLWKGKTTAFWPETLELLKEHDPILHVDTMFPTAVLMVSGGEDKVVDPATARAFVNAARPHYQSDPERLRLVVYEGFGHNLPLDVVRLYTEHWFHLYMHPTRDAPSSGGAPRSLNDSVKRTQINAADHKDLIAAARPATRPADPLPPAPDGKVWKLVWHDEFDGRELDASKWEVPPDAPRKDGWWVRRAVRLDGEGHLAIKADRDGDRFISGCVRTRGRFEHAFGYYVARIRLQRQPGHWSAFWLMGPGVANVGDAGRDGTEIDIMEKPSLDGRLNHALHWDGYGDAHRSAAHQPEVPGVMEGFHTFGLLWTPDEYVFDVDGDETWRTSAGGVCQVPLFIKLSNEIGRWAGDIRDAKLPDEFLVDYVRVYDLVDDP